MRLGLIARSDNSGLGMQTLEFYKHMKPQKTMVVDISKYNGNKTYPERYDDNPIGTVTYITGFPQDNDIDEFLKDLDVVFIAESAYNNYLYKRAKELGVKTANQYNYEFFDWFNPNNPKPDMLIAPSKWYYNDVQRFCEQFGIKHVYLHCPVNRTLLPYRNKPQARVFLHTAGKSAAYDRNGTETVIRASKMLKTDAQIIVHFQGEQGLPHQATHSIDDYRKLLAEFGDSSKLTIEVTELENYEDVYTKGDVLVLPRRYGGNCLPLNEALSVGMPALMTDICPNDEFLPAEWLIRADKIAEFTPRTLIDIYGGYALDLANLIDDFYNMTEEQFAEEQEKANSLANMISWETLAPRYREVFEQLCTR